MKNFIIIVLMLVTVQVSAQKYVTKSGEVSFYSETPVEKIAAINNKVMSAYDAAKQIVVVKILVKSFRFQRALMEEHFNENYVESDVYPNSTFKGKFIDKPNLDSKEVQNLKVKGKLKIHGIEKVVSTTVKFQVVDGDIITSGKFNVKLSDFDVDIPSAVVDKIAKDLEISFNFNLKAL